MTDRAPHVWRGDESWKPLYLEAFAKYGVVTHACEAIGISPSTVNRHMNSDPEFAKGVAEAKDIVRDRLRKVLVERAVEGWMEPVYQQGEHVGDIRRFDNKLAMWLAERMMPEDYHLEEQRLGDDGRSITFKFVLGEKDQPAQLEAGDDVIEEADYTEEPE